MRVIINYREGKQKVFKKAERYSDLAFADRWFWVEYENKKEYIAIDLIANIVID